MTLFYGLRLGIHLTNELRFVCCNQCDSFRRIFRCGPSKIGCTSICYFDAFRYTVFVNVCMVSVTLTHDPRPFTDE